MLHDNAFPIDQPCAATVAAFERRAAARWHLNGREARVLLYAVCGMTIRKHVARALDVSERTVRAYWSGVYAKLAISDDDTAVLRCLAVVMAWRMYYAAQADVSAAALLTDTDRRRTDAAAARLLGEGDAARWR